MLTTLIDSISEDRGRSSTDFVTNDNQFSVFGSVTGAESTSVTVDLVLDNTAIASFETAGQWVFSELDLPDGTYTLTATASEMVQTGSGLSTTFAFSPPVDIMIDTSNPGTPATNGSEFLVNEGPGLFESDARLAMLADGRLIATWTSSDPNADGDSLAVLGRIFDENGNPDTLDFVLSTETEGAQLEANAVPLADGGFMVVWRNLEEDAVKGQVFDAEGSKQGAEFLVSESSTGIGGPRATALVDGNIAVVFSSSSATEIQTVILNADGGIAVSEFLTSVDGEFNFEQEVAALDDGRFVVTWRSLLGNVAQIKAQVFNADLTRVGNEFTVSDPDATQEFHPTVATLESGDLAFAWTTSDPTQDGDGRAIKLNIFDANGEAIRDETLANSETVGTQERSEIARLPNGGFIVTWASTDPTQDGSQRAIKAQAFTDQGEKVGAEFLVNSETFSGQFAPSVVGLQDGFAVAWETKDSSQDGLGSAIKAQLFTERAARLTEISEDTGAEPDDLVTNDRLLAFFGVAEPDSTVSLTLDGNAIGNQTADSDGTWAFSPASLLLADGTYDFRVQATDLAGNESAVSSHLVTVDTSPPDAPQEVGQERSVGSTSNGLPTESAIASLSNGNYVVGWINSTGPDDLDSISAQIYDANGTPQGNEILVSPPDLGREVQLELTAWGDGFAASWTTLTSAADGSSTAVMARFFDANGAAQSSEFVANTVTEGFQTSSAGAQLTSGDVLLTWTASENDENSDIKGQFFDTNGGRLGQEFLVNVGATFGDQNAPAAAGLSNGNVVAVWVSDSEPGAGLSVVGRIFDISGAPLTQSEFVANDTDFQLGGEVFLHREPSITGLADGRFVVVWRKTDVNTSTSEIELQLFGADGLKEGDGIQVNTETAGEQSNPQVITLPDGTFVVAWETGDPSQDGDGSAIKAQVFDAMGNKIGSEFLANDAAFFGQYIPGLAALPDGFALSFGTATFEAAPEPSFGTDVRTKTFALPTPTEVTGIVQDTGAKDGITRDSRPTFNGKAAPDASVDVFLNGRFQGTTQADENGFWTIEQLISLPLKDGNYVITAQATDLAGNTGARSAPFQFTVDQDAPLGLLYDFDDNGVEDVLWRNTDNGTVGYWATHADGTHQFMFEGRSGLQWEIQEVVDYDSNGYLDILWRNTDTGTVGYWAEADGTHSFVLQGRSGANWDIEGVADFDNNGYQDILWRNEGSGSVGYWARQSDGTHSFVFQGGSGSSWEIKGVADFDNNGFEDILWRNTDTGGVGFWAREADGSHSFVFKGGSGSSWDIEAVADYDNNGVIDLLWRNADSGTVGFWATQEDGSHSFVFKGGSGPSWEIQPPDTDEFIF